MPPKKDSDSLLDGDFIEENDFREDTVIDVSDDDTNKGKRDEEFDNGFVHGFDADEKKPKKNGKDEDDLTIEIVSDAPEKDAGKWVIDPDKDGEPPNADDNELRSYSKSVQKRIKDATARAHAERRRGDEQARQLAEAVKVAESLLARNNQLSELVESGEKVLIGEHKGRLEATLAAAKQAFREAHDAGDVTGQIAAQENIAKAAAALDRVSVHRATPLQKESLEDFRKQFPQQQVQPRVDERTENWKQKNDWFGTDQLMTAYALAVDAEAKKRGMNPATDASYWKTIDSEMRKRFPEKFDAPVRRQSSIVAAAGRQGSGDVRKVTLTESQVRLAKRLNLTTEQYARQIMKEQQNRDNR